ncbi:MAG: aldo/keto reductase [Alphaproteobacteria bacterium]|nr:aldo/keto reductase [Alphaproteobacteria bacterium]
MSVSRSELAPGYSISRVIKGGWHLAGGHGAIDRRQAIADMASFVRAGITTFDCADIYTGVEELIGAFRAAHPDLAAGVQVHTKYVPDLDQLPRLVPADTERVIDRSLARLGVERLDLVQFHWWDYEVPGFVEAARTLAALQRKGKIRLVGVTNFDVPRLRMIVDAGVALAAHQLQYSLLDRRPRHGMVEFCARHGIGMLCFGTVAGGFLSERWLGVPEPREAFANRSLTKYKLIIEDFGGWALFQELLATLDAIARRLGTDIASVASAVPLGWPGVNAVIVGATNASHLSRNASSSSLSLTAADRDALDAILSRSAGPLGDCYALERDRTGRHGRIMKYNLSNVGTAGAAR